MKTVFSSKEERYKIARYLALILRELAPSLKLKVDNYGWVTLDSIISVIKSKFPNINLEHIKEIVEKDAQRRFEISGNKIRAKAGHKFTVIVPSPPTEPPEFLYHGTSQKVVNLILKSGILKKGKSYVHLASTIKRARRIGLRKDSNPVILKIEAKNAYHSGINFWKSGQISPDGEIFLSDEIPPKFISRLEKY